MKKFALALASMLLVLSAAGAVAAVPSKTTTDVTRVKAVESTEPTMNEFVTLTTEGTAADVKVTFTFTTRYTVDQKVVDVIGLYDGTRDANGQYNVEWVVLDAEVLESGDIAVEFPAELVERMKNAVATAMAVLND